MRNLIRGLIPLLLVVLPAWAKAGVFVGVSVNFAPPVLPVYVQPAIPAPGYLWTPGYWAWAPTGYYWVPGTWVLPPTMGVLWTPGYWGWADGAYLWHAGYWGPHVGFYGGVNYGFGYGGVGYEGGYWRGSAFFYNRAVNNVRDVSVTNVYNRTVINNVSATRVSYNGGAGGIVARPSAGELAASREPHVAFTSSQRAHEQRARANPSLRAALNGGHPPIAATAKPAAFSAHGIVAPHEPPANPGRPSPEARYAHPQPSAGAPAGGYAHSGHEPQAGGGGHPGGYDPHEGRGRGGA
jgi:hypothetical protein